MTEAPPKDYTITCERFMPSQVLKARDMLFGILMKSNLYDEAGALRMVNDCLVPGGLQMWVLRGDTEGKTFAAGCMVTAVYDEPYSGKKWMLLMHVNDLVHITFEQWKDAYDKLMAYAKERGCGWMEVYTDNPRAKELLEAFDFAPAAYRKVV